MTTTPSGLGEPRGPRFVSPELDPALRPGGYGPEPAAAATATGARWRRRLLAAVAVVALSTVSGGLAGGYVADYAGPAAVRAAASPSPSSAAAGVPADLVNAAAQALPGVVSVQVGTGNGMAGGSGFAIDDRQHIITNDHILAGGTAAAGGGGSGGGGAVTVVGPDGRRLPAEVVGRDPGSDIAVLRVPSSAGLRPLPLAQPRSTRVGEPVLAVGSPLGLSGTVTAGIVSALDRQVRLGNGGRQSAVQTDASINPGNSGGPLVNARGEVIGVNTAIATLEGSGNIGIGFAIPIERAEQVADRLIRRGG
ncbi:Trypsin-like peptidase domain-containing protein [Micromonospora pattaloongensis]|uniref:Trypsin-like peptidase domain-containing protein n=1 Tax=Micromonospora pattaloongensis TaxID=405436 RepID=A0A1H3KVX4_9ACTN|nr:trypsin-like peptidase domain-containing protein [Micromonospora pattaloongensis]SDY56156.1 Trypsin-like peptidase domain-containing protein [Micromonospora pattaloongensis]